MRKLQTLFTEQTALQPVAQEPPKLKIGHIPIEIADEAGAVVKIGCQKKNYSREVLDDYFRRLAE